MSDLVKRLREAFKYDPNHKHADLWLEAASELEHFQTVYGHITPDQAEKIKAFQASMAEFQKRFPDKGEAA